MELPHCVHNWLVDFFRAHTYCSRFGGAESEFIAISASIIQGLAGWLAFYVVTGSDLRPLTPGNSMVKFADDTYLVIPASNCGSCAEEKQHVGVWSSSNNQRLNHVKSMEIVFYVTSYHPGVTRTTRLGPEHTTSLSQFELLHWETKMSLANCFTKTLVAFDYVVTHLFHFSLASILCISVLTVTCITLLLTYLSIASCRYITTGWR